MTATALGGRVLDASALVDAVLGKTWYVRALVTTAVNHGLVLAVPAPEIIAAAAAIPIAVRPSLDVVLGLAVTVVDGLDEHAARSARDWLADAAAPGAAATVAGFTAWRGHVRGWPIVTTETRLYQAISPEIETEALP